MSVLTIATILAGAALPARAEVSPETPETHEGIDYHLVGWSNMLMPGLGRVELGEPGVGALQFGYESSAFVGGYFLSNGAVFSLDGFATVPPSKRLPRGSEINLEGQLYGDILQEFGIKAHMVNTYEAYRLAAWRSGASTDTIDDTPVGKLFLEPFQENNLLNPWVWLPLLGVLGYTAYDYATTISGTAGTVSRFTPYSNFLYGFNYGVWQPIGSGAPEEMFYRGFLQNEFMAG